ncbi:UVR8 [Scenedesmus sp. PABB004]|nr:UVR8 [Scenedesmus sp. PABB004]
MRSSAAARLGLALALLALAGPRPGAPEPVPSVCGSELASLECFYNAQRTAIVGLRFALRSDPRSGGRALCAAAGRPGTTLTFGPGTGVSRLTVRSVGAAVTALEFSLPGGRTQACRAPRRRAGSDAAAAAAATPAAAAVVWTADDGSAALLRYRRPAAGAGARAGAGSSLDFLDAAPGHGPPAGGGGGVVDFLNGMDRLGPAPSPAPGGGGTTITATAPPAAARITRPARAPTTRRARASAAERSPSPSPSPRPRSPSPRPSPSPSPRPAASPSPRRSPSPSPSPSPRPRASPSPAPGTPGALALSLFARGEAACGTLALGAAAAAAAYLTEQLQLLGLGTFTAALDAPDGACPCSLSGEGVPTYACVLRVQGPSGARWDGPGAAAYLAASVSASGAAFCSSVPPGAPAPGFCGGAARPTGFCAAAPPPDGGLRCATAAAAAPAPWTMALSLAAPGAACSANASLSADGAASLQAQLAALLPGYAVALPAWGTTGMRCARGQGNAYYQVPATVAPGAQTDVHGAAAFAAAALNAAQGAPCSAPGGGAPPAFCAELPGAGGGAALCASAAFAAGAPVAQCAGAGASFAAVFSNPGDACAGGAAPPARLAAALDAWWRLQLDTLRDGKAYTARTVPDRAWQPKGASYCNYAFRVAVLGPPGAAADAVGEAALTLMSNAAAYAPSPCAVWRSAALCAEPELARAGLVTTLTAAAPIVAAEPVATLPCRRTFVSGSMPRGERSPGRRAADPVSTARRSGRARGGRTAAAAVPGVCGAAGRGVRSITTTTCAPACQFCVNDRNLAPRNRTCLCCKAGFVPHRKQPGRCRPCAPKTFSPTPGRERCTRCRGAFTSLRPAATSCDACAPGFAGAGCAQCGADTYSTGGLPDATACLACPAGTATSAQLGATSLAGCLPDGDKHTSRLAGLVVTRPLPPRAQVYAVGSTCDGTKTAPSVYDCASSALSFPNALYAPANISGLTPEAAEAVCCTAYTAGTTCGNTTGAASPLAFNCSGTSQAFPNALYAPANISGLTRAAADAVCCTAYPAGATCTNTDGSNTPVACTTLRPFSVGVGTSINGTTVAEAQSTCCVPPTVVQAAAGTPLTGVAKVCVGSSHACALMADSTARCWGSNSQGAVGNNATLGATVTFPATVWADASGGVLSGVVDITCGPFHVCAVLNNGSVRCWGMNSARQLGDGTTIGPRATPAVATVVSGAVRVAAAASATCALLSNGTAQCWGAISPTIAGVRDIACGRNHCCFLMLADTTPRCFGGKVNGQFGNNGTASTAPAPTLAQLVTPITSSGAALTGVASMGAGFVHTCAVLADNTVQCWGGVNSTSTPVNFGQLGDGTTTGKLFPSPYVVTDAAGSTLTDVAALGGGGDFHACALRNTGTVVCWGRNNVGQLGIGTAGNSSTFTPYAMPVARGLGG